MARDISLKKKTEHLNRQYLKELEKKNAHLEEFSYITSHDLQEPLRTLINYSGLFKKRYSHVLDEQGLELLRYIESATNRMQVLIRDILEYTRIGKEVSKVNIDTQEVVAHVIQDLSSLIHDTNAEIKIDALPKIFGYETEIRLVFQNLISNALKFKKLDINPYIEIGCSKDSEIHKFFVADNGIGIKPKYKKKVFQIFQRLHNQLAYPGTGIGLAHCKKIIERHQGEIWYEPNNYQGTTFYFTIKKDHEHE